MVKNRVSKKALKERVRQAQYLTLDKLTMELLDIVEQLVNRLPEEGPVKLEVQK